MSAIRTAVREGVPVFLRVCAGCGEEKVAVDASWSGFSPSQRRPDGTVKAFKLRCKPCSAEAQRAYREANLERARERAREAHARRMADPAYREAARAAWRAAKRRLKADAERREHQRVYGREWKRRRRAERPEEVNAEHRLWYAMKREREGKAMQQGKIREREDAHSVPRVSAEPFRRFLVAYELATGLRGAEAVAESLGIVPARVSGVLGGQAKVALDVVDVALLNASEVVRVGDREIATLMDLYPLEAA